MKSLALQVGNKDILRFAIPISFSLIIPQINYITNNIFLSRLGETELGTAGITGVYYLIFSVIGFGFNSGLQSILSRGAGQENRQVMGRYLAQAFKLVLIMAMIGICITMIASESILSTQIQNHEVLELAKKFILIRIFGLPFLYLYQLGNSFLISSNNTRFLIIGSVAEASANILLDYGLIFGHFGLPALGFQGAAIATVAAECIGMLVVHGFLWWKKLPHEFKVFDHVKWDREASYKIFDRSAPLIVQLLFSIISWFLFYLWIEHLGEQSLAISNTMRNAFGICGVIIWAMAATANNMISNLIGQAKIDQVIPTIRRIAWLNLWLVLPIVLFLFSFPGAFFSIFNGDSSFIQQGIPVLQIVASAILLMSQGSIWLNAISGTGLTRVTLLIEILTVGVYVLYVYFAVKIPDHTLIWAWASEFFYWGIIWICAGYFFFAYPWQEKYTDH
jgi:multidrug resistance protein, MATE family